MCVICAGTDCFKRRNWILTSDPKIQKLDSKYLSMNRKRWAFFDVIEI